MFIENFLLGFCITMLSIGFVFYMTDDLIEGKILGSRYCKRIILIGVISALILIYLKIK